MSVTPISIDRIAAGIVDFPEGRDAAVLAVTIGRAVGAELLLVAVHPAPLIAVSRQISWTGLQKEAERLLARTRDEVAHEALTEVVTSGSVPRALEHLVEREHRDLLVLGSSHKGPAGRVQISTLTRQLLGSLTCALAVAPRGFAGTATERLARVGVGYDASPESGAALSVASSIARGAGAQLAVQGVVDDRLPVLGWSSKVDAPARSMWNELLEPMVEALREDAEAAVAATGVEAQVEILRSTPSDALRELSERVDLLVIGARGWGTPGRVLVGSTGESLLQGAGCPVLVTPRPEVGAGAPEPHSRPEEGTTSS